MQHQMCEIIYAGNICSILSICSCKFVHTKQSHKAYQIDWLQFSAVIDRKLFLRYREGKNRIGE